MDTISDDQLVSDTRPDDATEGNFRRHRLHHQSLLTQRATPYWLTAFFLATLALHANLNGQAGNSWIAITLATFLVRYAVATQTARGALKLQGMSLRRSEIYYESSYVAMTIAVSCAPFALTTPTPMEWKLGVTILLLVAAIGPFAYLSTSWIPYSVGSGAYIASITAYWLSDKDFGAAIVAATFLLWAVLIASARANSKIFTASFLIRHENERLLEDLRIAEKVASANERATHALKEEAIAARGRAEQANIEKSNFIASTSHDLRQPLFAISLHLGVLKQNLSLPPEALKTVDKLENSLQSIDGMLAGLLELSVIEAKSLRPDIRAFQWREIHDRLTDEFTIQAESKNLRLNSITERIELITDPLLLERVTRNILSNAIRHTEHGEIRFISRSTADGFEIEISDDGPGIAEEAKARIFDDFFQNPSRANGKVGSSGIGLAISRRICDALNVELTLVPSATKGAQFRIRLDASQIRTQYNGTEEG